MSFVVNIYKWSVSSSLLTSYSVHFGLRFWPVCHVRDDLIWSVVIFVSEPEGSSNTPSKPEGGTTYENIWDQISLFVWVLYSLTRVHSAHVSLSPLSKVSFLYLVREHTHDCFVSGLIDVSGISVSWGVSWTMRVMVVCSKTYTVPQNGQLKQTTNNSIIMAIGLLWAEQIRRCVWLNVLCNGSGYSQTDRVIRVNIEKEIGSRLVKFPFSFVTN